MWTIYCSHLLHIRISGRRHDEVIEYSTEGHRECAAIRIYQPRFEGLSRNHQSSIACKSDTAWKQVRPQNKDLLDGYVLVWLLQETKSLSWTNRGITAQWRAVPVRNSLLEL
jgi:hypothetical protein